MVKKILAICDGEEKYLSHMADYLEKKALLPFAVHAFTDIQRLEGFAVKNEVEILLIAESSYKEQIRKCPIANIYILNESGTEAGEGIMNINKYQSSDKIFTSFMNSYMSDKKELSRRLSVGNSMKIIGNYTPVGRCLQTTFALSMGQLLAKKHKTLYLNFESYSGLSCLLDREFTADITDVLYYFNCEKEKLAYRMESMTQDLNGLSYIPPVISYNQLNEITGGQWIQLFQEIERTTNYEYLILDLSEQINGLHDILRECSRIFTIIREDGIAEAKVRQYETILQSMDYGDIALKTKKWRLPVFQKIPYGLDRLTYGELAEYVKKIIEEEVYEQLV